MEITNTILAKELENKNSMKHYVLTSHKFTGQVEFKFNDNGMLNFYKEDAMMTDEQRDWMLRRLPLKIEQVSVLQAVVKGRLDEIPPDLTFETAYAAYNYPRNRYRAEAQWAKLKEAERLLCLKSFRHYQRYVDRKGIATMCFDRYLKERHWETDWDKLQ